MTAVIQAGGEGCSVETKLIRVSLERIDVERILTDEHLVVELPELPLVVSAVAGFRRLERVGMAGQRVVFVDETDLSFVPLEQLVEGAGRALAERTLEI